MPNKLSLSKIPRDPIVAEGEGEGRMRDQDKIAIFDAMDRLSSVEDGSDRDEAVRIAWAQMVASVLFIEARVGKARADAVVAELWRAQLGERMVHIYPYREEQTAWPGPSARKTVKAR
ncbi:hypothetical protein [Mesorhizobium sp. B4-1-4]|uniref:hypothetical protein n=1 Tax=Mesorhizobium sp. B4-1-4 TaxID=2589888 RepID=UPI00112B02BF|nr:hypothetical protein [Mesorhizobium sp. B4-1-4]UCI33263.1 hypothetical protein FJW03_07495 [Mesorhizobium sp. B4-1-4]